MMYPEYVPPLEKREAGLTMRVIGWLLLSVDAMILMLFAPVSLRDGSLIFPIWAVVQALVGVALVTEGDKKETATEEIPGSIIAMPARYTPEEPRRAA